MSVIYKFCNQIFVKVKSLSNESIFILGLCYFAPDDDIDEFLDNFNFIINNLFTKFSDLPIILGG